MSNASNGAVQSNPWNSIEGLLNKWEQYSKGRSKVHYEAAHYYGDCAWRLGLPTVFLASIVSTGVFATLKDTSVKGAGTFLGVDTVRLLVACFSVVAAALTGLQNFARFAERAEKHKGVASRYGAIHREIEATLALPIESRMDPHKFFDAMRAKLDGCETNALDVSTKIWLMAKVLRDKPELPIEQHTSD